MFLRKGLLCFSILGLLICTGEAIAGPNANAVLSLDLIADGGAGNQRDDGVTSGTVSGQGTKIAVEVFAKGVTTPLIGILVEFGFDASVLTYVRAQSSEFIFILPVPDGTAFSTIAPVTLSESGFLVRAEFTTAVDVTDREFSIGIKKVGLAEGPMARPVEVVITTTNVITFNTGPSSDVAPSPDFDGDGVVGIPDFLLFVDRFGALRGDGKYEAKYDLDGNGVIGIPDFLIFVDNFGKEVPPSGDAEMVAIPDMNLRAVIEDSLGKASGAPITRSEMATLTRFAAVNANISDLTGLEFATGLTVLRLSANSIVDISPLSGLTNLTVLELSINSIVDISPLSGLTGLTELGLSANSIVDISPLSGLTNLTVLRLENNLIVDISSLSGLISLTTLFLENILLPPPIPGLVLSNNSISDLSPLVANTGLGSGDAVHVRNNPLSATSINTHIPTLHSRGVAVLFTIDDPTPVSIPDANLRAEIEDALDKSSGETITREDMSNLTRVSAGSANISDLTGLEFATNLLSLYLYNNTISDVSALSGLTILRSLTLRRNSITDISPLSGLTNLSLLRLEENSISDVSALSGLTSLEQLNLHINTISDVSALSGLTNLTSLTLYNNSIVDISPLSGLTNLEWLRLRSNSITDLSPLVANTGWGSGDRVDVRDNPLSATSINTHIPVLQDRGVEVSFDPAPPAPPAPDPTPVSIPDANLRAVLEDSLGKASGETITRGDMANLIRLIARNANISDLTGLEFAFNLTRLDLGTEFVSGGGDVNSNHISDLSPLSGLNNLTSLNLERNSISDVSALSGLTSLTTLWLPNNLISDISSLANLTNIWESSFSSNLISDVSPLADWTNLEWLYLNRNSISDVSALSGLTSLKGLGLSDNSISDIAPLSGLTSLTDLSLFSSSISDVSALAGLTSLQYLYLFNNSISDVSALSDLTSLIDLELSSNSISDVSALAGLTSLERLGLSHNSISDIAPLSGLTSLTDLSLFSSSISDVSALAGLTNLTSLTLYNNSIVDISPLVENTGLGSGDVVAVWNNPLSATSINTHIPALQGRGVTVQF